MNVLINELKSNPIFQMSLHSKELFHSNFWAWLFERDMELGRNNGYVTIFFEELSSPILVYREQGNRDITVWQTNTENGKNNLQGAYVIENKLKSVPDKDQLERYKKDLGDEFIKGVITGVIVPTFDIPLDWKFMSYDTISEKIKEKAGILEKDGFEKELIIRYADMIAKISRLIIASINEISGDKIEAKKWIVNQEFFKSLDEIRMDDIVKKLIASDLAKYIQESYNLKLEGYKLEIYSFYSHKNGAVEIRYVADESNKNPVKAIGIQIQDDRYTWNLKGDGLESTDKLFREFVEKGWFVSFDKKNDNTIKGHKTKMSNEKCKYGNDFVYQYWIIEDSSFIGLRNQIIADMTFARELINKTNQLYLIEQ